MSKTDKAELAAEVTVSEAAEMADVDVKTVRRWIAAGLVEARQLPGGETMPFLISLPSLVVYLEARSKKRDQPGG